MCKSWYYIETISVSRTVFETFSIEERRDLKTGGKGRSRSLKMAPFDIDHIRLFGSPL